MASTSPARARRTASVTASPAILPASSGSGERGAVSSATMVTSASRGASTNAFFTTSGPMPRGSPSVTATRGRRTIRLVSDVDVRHAAEEIEIMLDRELLAERVLDPVLHLVERELAFGEALGQLEHDEPWPRGPGTDLEHGLEARHAVVTDRFQIVGRQLRHREPIRQLRLIRICVASRQGIERTTMRRGVVHRVGLGLREGDLRSRDRRLDQDMARKNFRRLCALHLDDVIPELGPHRVRDGARLEPERDILELLHHHAATEPAELTALLP